MRALTQNKKTLVIAAISSRPYVKAAVAAGFDVISIDGFADKDTQRLAKAAHLVRVDDMQLAGDEVLAIIASIEPKAVEGFCYGAGFEMQPTLLSDISQYLTVLGNTAEVVAQSKNPRWFFKCCDEVGVLHPSVMFEAPKAAAGHWLQKTVGGSGGGHVKVLPASQPDVQNDVYFQKHQTGILISCLFLAGASGVHIIGFNEQWLDSSVLEPFRYGGAVSHAEVRDLAKARMIAYVKQLALAMDLVGLNSCDAVCDGDDVYVLEINPRLSATMDLYTSEYRDLMAMHVVACCRERSVGILEQSSECEKIEVSAAHQVIYADGAVAAGAGMDWPIWVEDVPAADIYFKAGMPICTVVAEAETASLAKEQVQERAAALKNKILN